MAQKRPDRLILRIPEEVSERLDRLFDKLAEDPGLRMRYVEDPNRVLGDAGLPTVDAETAGLLSRVIFDLADDREFEAWVHEYVARLRERFGDEITLDPETAETVAREIEQTVVEHLPPELAEQYRSARVAAVVMLLNLFFYINVAVGFNVGLGTNFFYVANVVYQEQLIADVRVGGGSRAGGGGGGGEG